MAQRDIDVVIGILIALHEVQEHCLHGRPYNAFIAQESYYIEYTCNYDMYIYIINDCIVLY